MHMSIPEGGGDVIKYFIPKLQNGKSSDFRSGVPIPKHVPFPMNIQKTILACPVDTVVLLF